MTHDPDEVRRLLRNALADVDVPPAPGPGRARRVAGRRATIRTAGAAAVVAALVATPIAVFATLYGQRDLGPSVQPTVAPAPSTAATAAPPTVTAAPTADALLGPITSAETGVLAVGTLAGFTPEGGPATVDPEFVAGPATWALSPCSFPNPQDYDSDAGRTGWWSSSFGAGDSGTSWQVATYGDAATAAAAVDEIRAAIQGCGATSATVTVGRQSWGVSEVTAAGTLTGGFRSFGDASRGDGTYGPQFGGLFHINRDDATVTLVVTDGLIGTTIAVSGGDTRPETGAVPPVDEAAADREVGDLSGTIAVDAATLRDSAVSYLAG